MELRDILTSVAVVFCTMWAMNYFFPTQYEQGRSEELTPGSAFTAAPAPDMLRPLNRDVDFFDAHLDQTWQQEDVAIDGRTYVFSTGGGTLNQATFTLSGKKEPLTPIMSSGYDRERQAFLLAFDQKAPFAYKFTTYNDDNNKTHITYVSSSDVAEVAKSYTLYHDTYKIDVTLHVKPLSKEGVRPRIFLPAPNLAGLADRQVQSGLVYNDKDQVEKLKMSDIDDKLWLKPALFGAENQYFINALVDDDNGFTQRGYFVTENNALTTILEGPKVEEETSWTLSFYCGPKESRALSAVDTRLEETLDYGFFAPISKMLMYLLRLIYDYVGNYGWAIIILTLLVRLIMVPFTLKSEQSTKNMRELDRRMKVLDKKYHKDSEELKTEKANLMRTYGMPAGFGCLIPLLLQVPIFLGLSNALRSSIELYKAPFIFWIHDLSAPDPYYILPLLVFLGFMANAFNVPDTKQRMSFALAGIFFIAVVTNLAAGLALYIACSILAGVAQSYITKKIKAA